MTLWIDSIGNTSCFYYMNKDVKESAEVVCENGIDVKIKRCVERIYKITKVYKNLLIRKVYFEDEKNSLLVGFEYRIAMSESTKKYNLVKETIESIDFIKVSESCYMDLFCEVKPLLVGNYAMDS